MSDIDDRFFVVKERIQGKRVFHDIVVKTRIVFGAYNDGRSAALWDCDPIGGGKTDQEALLSLVKNLRHYADEIERYVETNATEFDSNPTNPRRM